MLDGGVVAGVLKLLTQDVDLGEHLIHAELIVQLKLGELPTHVDQPVQLVGGAVLIGP